MSTPATPAVPLDEPVYGIAFGAAVKRGFKKYADFNGRASRSEFWYWYAFYVGVTIILAALTVALGVATAPSEDGFGTAGYVPMVLLVVFYLGVLLPTLALVVRRLHDAGFSGLYLLLGLITGLIPLIMCVLPTSPQAARFGPPGQAALPGPYGAGYPPAAPGYAGQGYGQPGYPAPQGYGQAGYAQQGHPQPGYGAQPDPAQGYGGGQAYGSQAAPYGSPPTPPPGYGSPTPQDQQPPTQPPPSSGQDSESR